jgi:hypothetical protein
MTFSTGLVGVEVSSVNCPSQETEETTTTTRHVENVILMTKGLRKETHNIGWDDGEK